VKSLLRSPLLTGLRVLNGSGVLDEDDVILVATDPRFAGLTHLGIGYNDLPDRAVEAVARSQTLSRLVELDYSGNRTTAAALQALASSPLGGRLTVIGLRQYHWGESRRLGRRAADLLTGFRGLRGIDLHGQQIGDEGAAVLSRSSLLASLRRLELGENALGVRGVTELLSSPHLAGLEELDLSNNPPGGEWVPALAAAGPRPIRKLALADNQLDAQAASLLSTADALGGLRELSLRGNPIGDRGVVQLAQSTRLSGLRKLGLQSCGIADGGAAALADSPALSKLAGFGGLGLSHNRYGPETTRRLRERFGYDPGSY
jgi:Leucine Rich repeat